MLVCLPSEHSFDFFGASGFEPTAVGWLWPTFEHGGNPMQRYLQVAFSTYAENWGGVRSHLQEHQIVAWVCQAVSMLLNL